MTAGPLLRVRGLRTVFATARGEAVAVDDVGFEVAPGELVGIVGESGSGKSVTALSIMGLLPRPPARIAAGEAWFEGRDLLRCTAAELRRIRGREIGMVFQEPMTSLNPVFTIGDQITEAVRAHARVGHVEARRRAVQMLDRVGLPAAARRLGDYSHQLSGGMRQRVMIAMALACGPKLLLADEPTTALDVTIQAQLLDLLRDLRAELGMAIVLITHNMGVIAEYADRVLVMYAGRIAESGPALAIFDGPRHPYTRGLLASTPDLTRDEPRLRTIAGTLPSPLRPPPGCRFAPRCGLKVAACDAGRPPFVSVGPGHEAACVRTDATLAWHAAA